MSAVAIIDTASGKTRGFVPTGWYPTAVALSADEKSILVASGYGVGSLPPSYKNRKGLITVVEQPTERQLADWTKAVRQNDAGELHRGMKGKIAPVRHVFYVIKENRTYH